MRLFVGMHMVEETKNIESCFSHFFKYEKSYNETMKEVL